MGNRIRYCTWARSGSSPELALLLSSARRFNIEIEVMPCNGFLDKPASLLRHISGLPDSELVLASDGYDVLYAQDEQAILKAFGKLTSPIVFGGETGCYHHFSDSKTYFDRDPESGPFRYLNSGLIMGYVGELRRMLEQFMELRKPLRQEYQSAQKTPGFFNDQTILGRIAAESDNVAVDTNAELFCTFADEKFDINAHTSVTPDGIELTQVSTRPCLLHVSHREKFYSVYLYLAHKAGIELVPNDLDWRLVKNHLNSLGNSKPGQRKIVLDSEFEQLASRMWQTQTRQTSGCKHVGVVFIGTGKYIRYFEQFYEAVSTHFLPGIDKTFFVFTDGLGTGLFHYPDVVTIPTPAQKWPFPTLFRFRHLDNAYHLWADTSHIIYFDADTLVHLFMDLLNRPATDQQGVCEVVTQAESEAGL